MNHDDIPEKSFKSLQTDGIDLSNEVLNIDFGLEAAKISEVKVRS